ncbi:MAG: sensor histidine kinase, partial [Lachnospiraceae bacterium]|nr:sensor histidine kinase [Lachnospiraceae bacterium]
MSKKEKRKKYLNVFHIRWVLFLAVSVIIGGIMSFGLVAYLVFGFKDNTAIHMLWMIPLMALTVTGAILIILHFMEKRLSRLMNAIHEVSDGNLDVEIDLSDAQEYEVVYKDFNKMVKELRLTKQGMQNTVNEIA